MRINEEIQKFASKIPDSSKILDFGCGEKPYYPFFINKAKEYVGIDIDESPEDCKDSNIIIQQGHKIPFPNNYFDAIISTQVFEHIEDLPFYASELYRVLKKGGTIFISAAFAWDYHPYPHDYWRVTNDGYGTIFKKFKEIEFSYDTSTIQTILQSLNLLISRKGITIRIPYVLINFLISRFKYNSGDSKLPANIFVFLKK